MQDSRISPRNNLDFIRTVLALGVLVYHTRMEVGASIWEFPWVACFIAISGFLITRSMEDSSGYLHFARKRCLRVLPAFFMSLVLVAALGGRVWPTVLDWLSFGFLAIGSNTPLWTLSVEEVLYALLAAAFALGLYSAGRPAVVFLSALIVLLTIACFFSRDHSFQLVSLSLSFAYGSLLYVARRKIPWSALAGLACLVAVIVLRNWNWHWGSSHYWLQILFLWPLLAYAMVALGLYAQPMLAWYKDRIGDPSYGIYVYHWPIMVWLHAQGIAGMALTWATLGLTFAAALTSWHWLEKKALQRKDRRGSVDEPVRIH